MSIVYKILCDVKWMHEYYLAGSNGQVVFDAALQADRLDFLFEQFRRDASTINRNLDFLVPEPLTQRFSGYGLKVIPSYSGFKLAIRCDRNILPDGTTVFTPQADIPGTEELLIGAREIEGIAEISSASSARPFKSIWYFTNNPFPFPRSFPFLSGPVAGFDAARTYAQGELALFAPNDVRMFLNNGAADPWQALPAGDYITDTDKLVVPLSFTYHFSAADQVKDAVFRLTDRNGAEVKKIERAGTELLRNVRLDFRLPANPVLALPAVGPSPASLYTLTVSSGNGYARTFSLLFADDSIDISQYAAIIGLRLKSPDAAFNLTDNDGFLRTRIQANGIKTDPPVFELWMKSRLVFWKYRNNRQKKIKLTPDTQDLLSDDDGILVTRVPQRLAYSPFLLRKPDNSFQYLPNPVPGDQVRTADSKSFVNIVVPASKMFPLV